ncbi:hypothetical protein MUCCIDRAFT_89138 [Mucor lusitanicus CBS 277.49]|uniref:Uncharacterized protein n=1 Tax=Mucor lusitanicus CBS 277.49 TaxID=747725 RepID=A0A162YM94_MUCCL|nr:hypothetical protein MUCCIDRAFT_89138 [Mucor lusitanicus CBS 277.49]
MAYNAMTIFHLGRRFILQYSYLYHGRDDVTTIDLHCMHCCVGIGVASTSTVPLPLSASIVQRVHIAFIVNCILVAPKRH